MHKGIIVLQKNFIAVVIVVAMGCCSDFLKVGVPHTSLTTTTVFTSDESAQAAILGLYSKMMEEQGFASGLLTVTAGLSSDELEDISFDPSMQQFNANQLSPNNAVIQILWQNAYQYIYQANAIVEGLQSTSSLTLKTKQQVEGEARFIRAFCYFYLVNMFGDVPLITTTSYSANAITARIPTQSVYEFIIQDLLQAQELLIDAAADLVKDRPNTLTVSALLARVYLYTGRWKDSEASASSVINSNQFTLEDDLDKVFLANSSEAIFQLIPVAPGFNTYEANNFVINGAPSSQTLNPDLIETFEPGDDRAEAWVGTFVDGDVIDYYPYKYKLTQGSPEGTEYYTVLRLAEQYLIRSEARIKQHDIVAALEDLNIIRARAGLSPIGTSETDTDDDVLHLVEQERKVELMAEWGHRWFDLKRYGHADSILGVLKPYWNPLFVLYPIPQSDRLRDTNLSQNEGY